MAPRLSFSVLPRLLAAGGIALLALRVAAGVITDAVTEHTWTGAAADGDITNPANWADRSAPANDGTATASFGTYTANYVDVTIDFSLLGLSFDAIRNDYYFTSSGNRQLALGSGGITASDGDYSHYIHFDSALTLGIAADQTWNINYGSYLDVYSVLTGTGAITKTGYGGLYLSGNSSFSGGFNLLDGNLVISSSTALGTGTLTVGPYGEVSPYIQAYSYNADHLSLDNAVVLNGGLNLYTNTELHLNGPVTLNADTVISSYGSPLFLTGVIDEAGGSRKLTVNTNSAVILNGTSNYTGGTRANQGAVIFGQADALPATGDLSSSTGAYVGIAFVPTNLQTGFIDRFDQTGTDGVIGFDTSPDASATNDFSQNIDLTGFAEDVSIGSATKAVISGEIIPQVSAGTGEHDTFRFGGGGGFLTVTHTLNDTVSTTDHTTPVARDVSVISSTSAPLTLWIDHPDYTGTTTVGNSAVIFGQLPATSGYDLSGGAYVGIGNSGVSPADFLATFTAVPVNAIIGFDGDPGSGNIRGGSGNDIDLKSAFPFALEDPNITIGTATNMTFGNDVTITLPDSATAYRFAGYKGGQLRVGSTLTGDRDVIIGNSDVLATFADPTATGNTPPSSVELFGTNDYTGDTILQAGRLIVDAQPDSSAPAIGAEGKLVVAYSYYYNQNGPTNKRLEAGTADLVIPNAVQLYDSLSVGGVNDFTLSGDIAGSGGIYLDHIALTLSGDNAYTGGTYLSNATLIVASDTAAGYGELGLSYSEGGSTVRFTSLNPTIGGLWGDGANDRLELDDDTTLTINTNGYYQESSDASFYGTISGAYGAIRKTGSGELSFYNEGSTYGGGTSVEEGALVVQGSSQVDGQIISSPVGTGAVTVSRGAILGLAPGAVLQNQVTLAPGVDGGAGGVIGGYGTYAPLSGSITFTGGQVVSPGKKDLHRLDSNNTNTTAYSVNSGGNDPEFDVGQLTLGTSDYAACVKFSSGGIYSWAVQHAGGSAGSGWDLIHVNGNAVFDSTAGDPFILNIASVDTDGYFNSVEDFNASANYSWLILETTGSISGLGDLAAISLDWSNFVNNLNGGTFSLSLGGEDTQLYLNFTPVPEPSTYALFGLGLGIVAWSLWRRRRRA